MSELVARIEAATDDETWELLREAAHLLLHGDGDKMLSFDIYEEANAPHDAALLLVPDGWRVVRYETDPVHETRNNILLFCIRTLKAVRGKGESFLLAIAAASVRVAEDG